MDPVLPFDQFEGLFSKLGSGDILEKKIGEKLLEQLWNNYIDEKELALEALQKSWCAVSFLKGIVDDNGTVRYRTVRIIDSVAFEIYEYSPDNFKNLLEAIKNKTLRSLTQGLEFLEYYAMRRKTIERIF